MLNLRKIYEKINLDGTLRKLIDVSLAKKYGWKYKTILDMEYQLTINDYLKTIIY